MFELLEMFKAFALIVIWILMFTSIVDTISKDYHGGYALWFCIGKGGLLFMMWICTWFFFGGSF